MAVRDPVRDGGSDSGAKWPESVSLKEIPLLARVVEDGFSGSECGEIREEL